LRPGLPSFAIQRDSSPAMVESPMQVCSAVKLGSLLALAAVATTACGSVRQEQALATAEQTKIVNEGSVDGTRKRAEYLKCVVDDATTFAGEPSSDAIAPGDLADVSLTKCGSRLDGLQEDFSLEMLSSGQDITRASAAASRTTDTVRAVARGKAVAVIVETRRNRTVTPTTAAASPPRTGS
jgi:hypothetical protein